MRSASASLLSILDRNIGRCPRCMRTAFICALAVWCAYFAARLAWPAPGLPAVTILAPIGLTALWLAHAITYGTRVFTLLTKEMTRPIPPTPRTTRRDLFRVLASTAAITTTAILNLSTAAKAQGSNCPPTAPWRCTPAANCASSLLCVPIGCNYLCILPDTQCKTGPCYEALPHCEELCTGGVCVGCR
jgi:hypothetical protein